MNERTATESTAADRFAREAEQPQPGLLAEFWDFLKTNRKWWLSPIIVMLLLIGALLIVQVLYPVAAPFIYAIF
jgi:hypothetical protein